MNIILSSNWGHISGWYVARPYQDIPWILNASWPSRNQLLCFCWYSEWRWDFWICGTFELHFITRYWPIMLHILIFSMLTSKSEVCLEKYWSNSVLFCFWTNNLHLKWILNIYNVSTRWKQFLVTWLRYEYQIFFLCRRLKCNFRNFCLCWFTLYLEFKIMLISRPQLKVFYFF